MWSQDKFLKALAFAGHAHRNQKMPGSESSYLVHIAGVSMEIMAAAATGAPMDADLALACALLHDVIEDTGVKYEEVEQTFGRQVADGVQALSKNKELEKELQLPDSLARIVEEPGEIGMVKLADRITNLQPPPSYWTAEKIRQYREEALLIHTSLKEKSPFLAARLMEKIEAYRG
jgi:(p)ppGpp synthase/HD superfamily hydrolase